MTPPSINPPVGDEREAFESHIQATEGRKPLMWSGAFANSVVTRGPMPLRLSGKYFIREDQKAWEAWQARAALAQQAPAPVGDETAGVPPSEASLLEIARLIEGMKRECGMDPESPAAVYNGRLMSIAWKVRQIARLGTRPAAEPQILGFEDNNGAIRKAPSDCQSFGAHGVPAAIWADGLRYVPVAEPQAAEPVLRGQLGVLVGLLRECIGPLEISAAIIESDDTDHMGALIEKIKDALSMLDVPAAKPTQASTFPARILDVIQEMTDWEDIDGSPMRDDAEAALRWIGARQAIREHNESCESACKARKDYGTCQIADERAAEIVRLNELVNTSCSKCNTPSLCGIRGCADRAVGEPSDMRQALSDLRYAVSARPSCQSGLVERCRCLKCAMLRSYDLLAASQAERPAPAGQQAEPTEGPHGVHDGHSWVHLAFNKADAMAWASDANSEHRNSGNGSPPYRVIALAGQQAEETPVDDKAHPRFLAGYDAGLHDRELEKQSERPAPAGQAKLIDAINAESDAWHQVLKHFHGAMKRQLEKVVERSDEAVERTPKDSTIEYAEYMVKRAEQLVAAVNDLALAEQEHDEGTANESDVQAAKDSVDEALRAVTNGVYEFRKRKDRALASQAERPAPAGLAVGDESPVKWRIATNRHPNTDGTRWGWIEGAPGHVCWSDERGSNLTRAQAGQMVLDHNNEVDAALASQAERPAQEAK